MRWYEWDKAKAESNWRKHGVRFEAAVEACDDPNVVAQQDRVEGGEQRWQTIGMAAGVVIILVAHTLDDLEDGDEVVRIISARRANRRERAKYEQDRAR